MEQQILEIKKFICECGKEFISSQSFNAHKSSCKKHYLSKYGSLEKWEEIRARRTAKTSLTLIQKNIELKDQQHSAWVAEKHTCEKCGKVMTEKYGSGRFCSRTCANSRKQSEETKQKISSLNKSRSTAMHKAKYLLNPKFCQHCGEAIPYERRRNKSCSTKCQHQLLVDSGRKAGLRSAQVNSEIKRSKNEIYFYELCKEKFSNVKHNEPIFNGWDADIIIEDFRCAILWNGPWHYRKITEKHSVEQVQNRDKIKLIEIKKAGYFPYIIKDDGKYDFKFVEDQFNVFLDFLKTVELI